MDHSAEAVAHLFVRAINRQDVEGLADLMTREHRFVDSLGNAIAGQDAARQGWLGYFSMVPDYSITVQESYGKGPVVIMFGTAKGTYVPPAPQPPEPSYYQPAKPKAAPEAERQLNPENQWKTPAAFRVLVEDGRVAEWRVYADNEPIREQMRKNNNK
jgi:hypothetical protein